MYVNAKGREDPNRLKNDIQEAVVLVVLVSNAKFTRKTRPLLDVDELSKLLLGGQVLGWIASAKPFPINDLRLRLGLIERCICRHRSLAGVDSIGIHGVEPR